MTKHVVKGWQPVVNGGVVDELFENKLLAISRGQQLLEMWKARPPYTLDAVWFEQEVDREELRREVKKYVDV